MTKTTTKPAAASPAPVILVFGVDENDKPRAARFQGAKPDLVAKAAQLMDLKLCEATSPELSELAQKLPAGRLYAAGKGFVPFVKRDLYAKLVAATGGKPPIAPGLPRSWEDIAVGHLVLGQADAAEDGWWEVIVVSIEGDMLTVRLPDYPKEPTYLRHRNAVALLNPGAR
jgi:hypothetical protein